MRTHTHAHRYILRLLHSSLSSNVTVTTVVFSALAPTETAEPPAAAALATAAGVDGGRRRVLIDARERTRSSRSFLVGGDTTRARPGEAAPAAAGLEAGPQRPGSPAAPA